MRYILIAAFAVGLFGFGTAARPEDDEQPRPIRDLTQALSHASSPEPKECIRGLKAIPQFASAKWDKETARVIARAFSKGNLEVRITVCQVAGELRKIAPEYGYSFASFLNSSEKGIRMAALQSLGPQSGTFDQEEVEAFVRALKDKDSIARVYAYCHLYTASGQTGTILNRILPTLAAPALIENLETESGDKDPAADNQNLLYLAVRALGKVGKRSPKAVPALLKVYARFPAKTERDAVIRGAVVEAMGEIGPFSDKSLPFLIKLMRDEALPIRERARAALAIGPFGPLAASQVSEIVALLKLELKRADFSEQTTGTIFGAIIQLGETAEPVIPYLLELAQGNAPDKVIEQAINALGDLGPIAAKQATPILSKIYFSKESRYQNAVQRALYQFNDHSVQAAIDALKGNDQFQQVMAIQLLSSLGYYAKPAIPELKRIATDRGHMLQFQAKSALRLIEQ